MKDIATALNQSKYLLLDSFLSKLLSLIAFIILTHTVDSSSIGVIGVSLGYMVILNYFMVSPESNLLKMQPTSLKKYNKQISSYLLFWVGKAIFFILASGIISCILYYGKKNILLSIFFFIFAFVNITNILNDLFTFLFLVRVRQKFICYTNALFSLITILLIYELYITKQGLLLYGCILLGVSIIKAVYLFLTYKRLFRFSFDFQGSFSLLRKNLLSYSLWIHFNNTLTIWLFYIDTAILSFFVALSTIGDYTIALKISFVFFQLPMIVGNVLTLWFQSVKKAKAGEYIGSLMRMVALFCIVSILIFAIAGKYAINMLLNVQDLQFVYVITLILLIGVSFMNIGRPLISLINSKLNVKKYFLQVTIPTVVVSLIIYTAATKYFGAYGTAMSNIICYLIYLLLLWLHVRSKVKIIFSKENDKQFWKQLFQARQE